MSSSSITESSRSPAISSSSSLSTNDSTIHVLVVDDVPGICKTAAHYFNLKENVSVHFELSGEAALEKFKQKNYHLILMDLDLSSNSEHMDGIATAQAILRHSKQHGFTPPKEIAGSSSLLSPTSTKRASSDSDPSQSSRSSSLSRRESPPTYPLSPPMNPLSPPPLGENAAPTTLVKIFPRSSAKAEFPIIMAHSGRITTSSDFSTTLKQCEEAGMKAYIQKPYTGPGRISDVALRIFQEHS